MAVKMTKGSRSKPPLSQLFSRRMALVFLFLAVLFARDFVRASVLEASEESENENTFKMRVSILLILTVLVVLSIGFEYFKDKVEESTTDAMEPIVTHFWQELTVLGFLSLLSFLAVKAKLLVALSKQLFDEDEKLPEMVETVHMLLFLVMVVFILEVLLFLALGKKTEKDWIQAEKDCKNPQKVVENYNRLKESGKPSSFATFIRGWCPDRKRALIRQRMEYLNMRNEFINPRDPAATKLPRDFEYCEYLSLALGELLGEVVEINPWTWLVLELLFLIFWGVSNINETVLFIVVLVAAYTLLLVLYVVSKKLDRIRHLLIKAPSHERRKILAEEGAINETTPLVSAERPPFLELTLRPRSALGEFFLGKPPNKHQMLFWFDRKGEEFLQMVLRVVLILSAIYVALVAVEFAPIVYRKYPLWLFLALAVAAAAPLIPLYLVYTPHIIRRMAVVCNIEMMKNNELVAKTIRIMKTRKSLRMLKLIQLMKFKTKNFASMPKQSIEDGGKAVLLKELPHEKRSQIEEVFNIFDKDGDGTVSSSELQDVMNALGHQISEVEAIELVGILDKDGDGTLDLEEFAAYMAGVMNEDESDDSWIETIFEMFDQDKSGSISREEFGQILSTLGAQLTHEDIEAIINEIDEDESGTIDMEEFEALIKKHLKD